MHQNRIRRYLKHGTLPQLMVFEAVSRHGNFTRAAEELYLAQPTVSLHVKKLTDTFGVPLFEQVGRRVHLTEAGHRLYDACQEIFTTLSGVDDALARLRRLESGSLRIAASTTAKYLAARLLAGFVKRYPGVEIALHVASRQALLARLAANTDDLYILGNAPQDQEVVIQHIAPNPVVVFAGRNHPLVGERAIPFARLAREPLLMREPGSGTRMMCDVAFTRNGAHPLVLMELGSNEAIKEALLAGLGAAVLCQHALGFESQQLAVLDVAGFPLEMHWHLAYPAGKALSPLAQAFMAFVRTEAARITSPHGASHGAPQSALSNDRHGDGGAPRAQ